MVSDGRGVVEVAVKFKNRSGIVCSRIWSWVGDGDDGKSLAGLRKREIDGRKEIELMVQLRGMDEINGKALPDPKGSTLPSPQSGIVGEGEIGGET